MPTSMPIEYHKHAIAAVCFFSAIYFSDEFDHFEQVNSYVFVLVYLCILFLLSLITYNIYLVHALFLR